MRKSRLLLAPLAALGLVVAACGGDDGGSSSETQAPAETEAPSGGSCDLVGGVAFDTGGRGDGTFNDSAGQGADRATSELGIEVKELEANVDEDRKANL
ncbi:MAG: hypothetical protein RLZZ39_149, partial [Actinomycetota bacterium]